MTRGVLQKIFVDHGLLFIFAGVFIYFSFATEGFLSVGNMVTVSRYSAEMLLLVFAFCLVFISGEFDLSFMYLFPLTSIIFAYMITKQGWPILPALGLLFLVAIIAGLGSGTLTIYVGLPSFFATISVAFVCYGLIHAITGPYSIPAYFPPWVSFIGKGTIGPIPFGLVLALIVFVGLFFLLGRTRFGRQLYAVGDDREAARNMGVRVNLYKMLAFVISGLLIGGAGLIYASRLSSGQATAGPGFMLPVLAAVFLGMTMFKVGRATIYGALIGAFFMNIINNGLIQMGIPFYWQPFASGIVLIGAVLVTIAREKIEI